MMKIARQLKEQNIAEYLIYMWQVEDLIRANGCDLEGDSAWLQICRVGKGFAFHYSVDGEHFYMMRYFHLPADPIIKVGLLAQAPTGDGGVRVYEHLTIEHRTVRNIRAGK